MSWHRTGQPQHQQGKKYPTMGERSVGGKGVNQEHVFAHRRDRPTTAAQGMYFHIVLPCECACPLSGDAPAHVRSGAMTYFYTPPKYWSSKLAWSLAFRGTIWFGQ